MTTENRGGEVVANDRRDALKSLIDAQEKTDPSRITSVECKISIQPSLDVRNPSLFHEIFPHRIALQPLTEESETSSRRVVVIVTIIGSNLGTGI